jgi:VanZ family protein
MPDVTPSRRRVALAWAPAVLYMAAIFALSSVTVQAPVVAEFPLQDKGLHALEFAVLGFLLAHATFRTWPDRPTWRLAALAAVIGVAWGVLDELHQALVPGRHAEVLDAVADAVGVVVGVSARIALRVLRGVQARRA